MTIIHVPMIMSAQAFAFACGALGAIIMFVADLVLYFPTKNNAQVHRTAASYFATVDPYGDNLANSSMQYISTSRVMFGGALGPVSALFYNIGFFGLALLSWKEQDSSSSDINQFLDWCMPTVAAFGLSLLMTLGSVYHALFAYTCFLSKEITKMKKKEEDPAEQQSLLHILQLHQKYLRYVYIWAAIPGMIGSIAHVYCCLTAKNNSPPVYSAFLVPVVAATIKKMLKRNNFGGIILCGGLTNLWNLGFFSILFFHVPSDKL